MTTNRRDVIKGTLALAGRSAVFSGGMGVAGTLVSCGGGGGSSAPPIAAPSALSYTSPPALIVGVAATALTPTVTGTVTAYAVSPSLPAGLSLNSATGVIGGTPTAAAAQATYTVTASNATGNTIASVVLTVNPALAISSLSSATPTALTPLTLTTAGLDVTQPFTVNLVVGAAAATPLTPYYTGSDGTVHVALPLNLDPTSGATGSYSATLTLTQGAQTTAASALTVQDIPASSSYGQSLGAISHAFLNYLALSQARVVNELQAIGVNFPTVDTSANQATLTGLSLNALHARNDIDRVVNMPTLQIPAGTDPTAGPIYFTSASVDIQDRLFGFYLNQLQGPVNASPAAIAAMAHYQRRAHAKHGVLPAATPSNLNLLVTVLGATVGGTLGVSSGIANAVSADSNTNGVTAALDSASAVLYGATKFLAIAAVPTEGISAVPALVTGALGACCALTSDLIKYTNSQDQIISLQAAGASQATLNTAIAQRDAAGISAATDVVGGVLSVLPGIPWVKDALDASAAAATVYQGAALVTSIAGLSATGLGKQFADAQSAGNQLDTVASGPTQGFGELTGSALISNNNGGTDLQTLYQANLTIPGIANPAMMSTISDPAGNYDVLVPLGNTGLGYASASVNVQDPSTGTVLGTEPINLSTMTDAGATAPSLTGTCNDDDASTPDGDDPDCD